MFQKIDLRGTWESHVGLLKLAYEVEKECPGSVFLVEQWHGNETRMSKAGMIPYNPLQKVLEETVRGLGVYSPGRRVLFERLGKGENF